MDFGFLVKSLAFKTALGGGGGGCMVSSEWLHGLLCVTKTCSKPLAAIAFRPAFVQLCYQKP